MESINIIQVKKDDLKKRQNFVDIYKQVFSEAPYFETYNDEWVIKNVWQQHLVNGFIVLALCGKEIIGLGCCIPLLKISDDDPNVKVKNFLLGRQDIPISLHLTCYMSEVAVLQKFRHAGLGRRLVQERFALAKEAGLSSYIMRTAASGSLSEKIYLSLGAQEAEVLQDVSDHAEEVNSSSKLRKFLYGRL
jgi:ribosomal protein S18 acetylase RimI-like enzyme